MLAALDQMFVERSQAMQLSLVSGVSPHQNPLRSFSSKAPFEYVDAGSLGATNGQYIIKPNNINDY